MIIHALRFRQETGKGQRAYRFRPGTGAFRQLSLLEASPDDGAAIMSAIKFVLTGRRAEGISEATLHVSDDSGDTWLVDRNATSVVCLKNGTPLAGDSPLSYLKAALLDHDPTDRDPQNLHVGCFPMRLQHGKLVSADNSSGSESQYHTQILRQINRVGGQCADIFDNVAMGQPKIVNAIAAKLERLYYAIQDAEQELAGTKGDGHVTGDQVERLRAEIELLEKIAQCATPLLKPQKRTEGLREELANTDAALADLLATAGLSAPPTARRVTDWRKPIEALARLEAYAKLIRATQGTKTYLDQNITPVYKEYLQTIDDTLVRDQQVVSELESCLASLTLQGAGQGMRKVTEEDTAGRGTWFDRFKGPREGAAMPEPERMIDVEGAKLAVEYTLGRLTDFQERMCTNRAEFSAMCEKLGGSHEELVGMYGRLKATWIKIADEFKLPKDLSLKQLIGIVVSYARIASLADKRESLLLELREQSGTHAKLEQLLLEWRSLTGSQKTTDLSHPTIAMTEARDVLRFKSNKQERLRGMEESRLASAVASRLSARLRSKVKSLQKQWDETLQEAGVRIPADHAGWPGWFQGARVIRSLALVYQAAEKAPAESPLFVAHGKNTPLQIYSIPDQFQSNGERLQFLKQVEEQGAAHCCRLLIVSDEKACEMLRSLGVGAGREIEDVAELAKPTEALPPVKPQAPMSPRHAPQPKALSQPVNGTPPGEAVLSSKAQEALAILTTKARL